VIWICSTGTHNLLAIAVATDSQRGGVGAALIRHVENAVRDRHGRLLLVETSTDPDQDGARAFYLKNNFAEEARIRDFYAPGQTKVIFWKKV
jgi:ribosomal protein S18 acetylase RimI-like enzyme